MKYVIEKSEWHTCKLCNKEIKDLAKIYGGCGVYYYQVFIKHLSIDHNLKIEEYIKNILKIENPLCKCGCGKQCKLNKSGRSAFKFKEYACGRFPQTLEWGERAKTLRKGPGNPMYGVPAWNKGETKYTNDILKKMGEKGKGKKATLETRKKQSESAKKRTVHGHTGHKHSQKTKEFLRKNTIRLHKEGIFKQTKTAPHIHFLAILKNLNLKYEEEKGEEYWSFDIYLPKYKVYIEIDGDYWHSNPLFYPDGPKTKAQKLNWTRDIAKNRYCLKHKLKLIRFWENEILNTPEKIKCRLKELLELEN